MLLGVYGFLALVLLTALGAFSPLVGGIGVDVDGGGGNGSPSGCEEDGLGKIVWSSASIII